MTTKVTNQLHQPVSLPTILRTTIGLKVLMALTGLVWVGFLVMHMYGNLKVFTGAEHFNEYAEGLRVIGAPIFGRLHLLTLMRFGMVAAIVLHIGAAVTLTRRSQHSRNVGYAVHKKVQATAASLTIRYGGIAILLFVVYHLMHFTWGVPGVHSSFIQGDPYHNLVSGFQRTPNVFVYLLALMALALHLYHGTWSTFQTLGINNFQLTKPLRLVSLALAVLIPLGFAVVPLSVMVGLVD